MRISLRLGLMAAAVCLIVAAFVLPADAQRRQGGSGSRGGASAQAAQPARGGTTVGTAVPRGYNAQGRPGGGPGGGAPPAGGGGRGGPGAGGGGSAGGPGGPGGGPGHGPGPGYGGGYRPGYGYGYRGGYPGYGSSFYFAFGGFYGPYYWSPWFYSPYWYDPFWYGGYYPPYGYGYGYGPGYYGYNAANLKVQVEPKNAEVYVDGHLAGIVDHFDGMFQSLMVEAGAHDIVVYLDGYRSIREHLYLNVGSTYRIKGVMEKLAPGEQSEPRPQGTVVMRQRPVQAGPEPPDNYPPPAPPQEPRVAEPAASIPAVASDSKFGQVAIRVQPGDAEVLIDGESWRNPQGADRLVVHLSPGTHRVEIRKEGFDPFVTAVEVKRGETTVLNVSLTRF
jgi:hypothetical protein